MSTLTFRGLRFLPEFKSFRGNGSSESTRFPEGLVLGKSVKPLHPRNVGLSKLMEQVRESGDMKKSYCVSDKSSNQKCESNGRIRPLRSNYLTCDSR
jgi:hypothetical protein